MLRRPRLRLVRTSIGFKWFRDWSADAPKVTDPLNTVWCTSHDTRDEAIDFYNKILEDFNANSF